MDAYAIARPLLFAMPPERAHALVFAGLDQWARLGFRRASEHGRPRTLMGLHFPNPLGIAAGLDKNGAHIAGLASLGVGFIEIGTVTPRPQPGNPRPRLFRLLEAEALINRMGFNNLGVDAAMRNVERAAYPGVLGVSIGRNAATPPEQAAGDYLACLEAVHARASYVAINVSSPNTRGLRDLQAADELSSLLARLGERRDALAAEHGRRVPLVVKVAPDLSHEQLAAMAGVMRARGVDGVIATNTTLARDGVASLPRAAEAGGLSGAPLRRRALEVVRDLADLLGGAIPIIGSGGIMNADDGRRMLDAGASLVQVYTGLIYRGPRLIGELAAL